MLELKKDKGIDYVIGWKSNGLFKSKLFPLYGAFLSKIKQFGCNIGIQFNNTHLVEGQNNYMTNIVNAFMIFNLYNE